MGASSLGAHSRHDCARRPLGPYVSADPARLPLTRVPSGFPSPADDYVDLFLALDKLVRADARTYNSRAGGESMTGVGLFPGDVLGVRRGGEPRNGDVVIAALDNEFTAGPYVRRGPRARRLRRRHARPPHVPVPLAPAADR